MDYQVRHAIPGRVRIYVPDLENVAGLQAALYRWLSRMDSARSVRINPLCCSAAIAYDPADTEFLSRLARRLESETAESLVACARADTAPLAENGPEHGVVGAIEPRGLAALAIASGAMGLALASGPLLTSLSMALALFSAVPIVHRACAVVWNESRLNVDALDSLAFAVAVGQGRLFTASFVTWLITLGDWIRDQTAAGSKRAITSLLDFQDKSAWVLRGGEKVSVPIPQIAPGETVVVYPGDMIPVDGEVVGGQASVDQRSITGESMPVLRKRGDKVYASSSVHEGKMSLRATAVGPNSLAAKIVQMVETEPVGETRAQNYAEKFADRLVVPTLAFGAGLYVATRDLNRTLSTFIVDFGTGIRVAAPTSVLATIAAAVRHGVLIRGGSHMERLDEVDTVVFDKTGTLTAGVPQVLDIVSYNERCFPRPKVLELAAAAEARFNHPVALATIAKARELAIPIPQRDGSRYHIGMGVEAGVNGYHLNLGNERFMRESRIKLGPAAEHCRIASEKGFSSLMLAVNGEVVGQLTYADRIRAESREVIRALKQRGIRELVMLTGDNPQAARAVARRIGLSKIVAQVLPEEKAELVSELRKQGRVVAMVGDGINDAPALTRASVGIAMGSGADIAQSSAHLVLMQNDLRRLVTAFDLSRDAMKLIRQNYAIVAGMNIVALALALGAFIPPELTALISNGSAVLASVNGLRPIFRN